jgi:peroxiredoxin
MPTMEALYQRYRDQGLDVIGVNVDKSSRGDVEAFLKEVAVTFRIVLDPAWTAMRAYGVRGLPTTFLIDRAGDAMVRETGERDWGSESSQRMVEELLREPGAAEKR